MFIKYFTLFLLCFFIFIKLKIDISFIILPACILGLVFVLLKFGTAFFACLPLYIKDIYKSLRSRKSGASPVFDIYGVHIFCGRVGCGKTISMVRRAQQLKRQYPNVKIYANFNTDVADGFITCWQDIVNLENIDDNGVNQGILFLFDEIHLTFSSQSWKTAPDNLLEYISLQRHMHKCIFGASQVWSRVNKVIKEQTDYVIECSSYFKHRLILNKTYSNEDYQINGAQKDAGVRKRPTLSKESFVATDKLRGLYNTDEIVKGLLLSQKTKQDDLIDKISDALRSSESA